MVMFGSGTFDYTFIVPDGPRSGSRRIEGSLREPLKGEAQRLIGHAPLLVAEEYQREAWQLFSQITLTPRDRKATAQSFSFSVDRELMAMLRRGDELHISRTECAWLGLSVLRGEQLVAAAGAVTAVPLGSEVGVSLPGDLVQQAEAIFRSRDPRYHMSEYPVEMRVGSIIRLAQGGRRTIGEYEIMIRRGFLRGIPGINESVSIERHKVCPDTAAHHTAELLEKRDGALQLPDGRFMRA